MFSNSTINSNGTILKVQFENLCRHPYHEKLYDVNPVNYLESSIKRTGKPVYHIIVVPIPGQTEKFWVISGWNRLLAVINTGIAEAEVMFLDITDEKQIQHLIVDLNNQRKKSGRELLMEFKHHLEVYPQHKGVAGNRYAKIGKELGISSERVKDLIMLINFFDGQGDPILESVFSGVITINYANKLKKVIEAHPEKFVSEQTFEKLCNKKFDADRLEYAVNNLSFDDETEYDLIESYLTKDLTPQEFHHKLQQLGKVEKRIDEHEQNKVSVPILDSVYTTEHAVIIKGDNREVEFVIPFGKLIKCLVGSPPYGNRRLNGNDSGVETGHHMNGKEYAIYLADTYEKYFEFMAVGGSIYVVVDDFRMENGAHACSLEHFVVEMEKRGAYLVGRYTWLKANAMPRSYADKDMVNSFEMVYRFALDPKNYYTNPNIFIELEEGMNKGFQHGCTNTTNDGTTSRGGSYYQSNLKKIRNTLEDKTCQDVIRGNVANPEDFFRQAEEKKHTSTAPIYLTATLILESTQPGDLCVDIWNGVGNTMVSALLLKRVYIGIEKEDNYFQQTCRRAQMTQEMLGDAHVYDEFIEINEAA